MRIETNWYNTITAFHKSCDYTVISTEPAFSPELAEALSEAEGEAEGLSGLLKHIPRLTLAGPSARSK